MNWSEKLLELEGKATPSGWEVDPSGVGNTDIVYRRPHQIGGAYGFFTDNESDAALIVHLRNRAKEIAALVQLVERHACPIRLGSHGADNCVCEYCQSLAALEDAK